MSRNAIKTSNVNIVKSISPVKISRMTEFVHYLIITYYITSAKFFIENFFANERKHPQMRSEDQLLANKSTRRKFCTWDIICDYCTCTF
jgi:hypothetical protein